jgi:hypothetical protein
MMTLAQRDVIVVQYQAYRSGALIVVLQAMYFYTGSEWSTELAQSRQLQMR